MQIWLKSANQFMRYLAHNHFQAYNWWFKSYVTLKIRSKSQKPYQLFIMSQCYIHANLVKLCQLALDDDISCTQETVTPPPAGSEPKTLCSPPLHLGGHDNITYSCFIKKTAIFAFMLSMKWSNINLYSKKVMPRKSIQVIVLKKSKPL